MSLELYTPSLDNRYEITHAISVQLSEYYNDIGKMILDVPVSEYNIHALKVGGILYDTEKKTSHIIQNVKADTTQNRITANGYTCNWLLNKRVINTSAKITTIESGMYSVVNANIRDMPNFKTAAVNGLTNTTDVVLYGGELLNQFMPILTEANLGQRMKWDFLTNTHVWEIYSGQDLTTGIHAVTFSEEQGTARQLVINDDDSTFKNVAYVVSEFNDTELKEIVGTATGADRFEKWFEVNLQPEDDDTEVTFRARMRTHGAMELGKLVRRKSFSVVVDATEFGTIYNLGDIVSCVSNRFGVSFNARIMGVKYKMDANGSSTEIILGEPILTTIGEVKLSG